MSPERKEGKSVGTEKEEEDENWICTNLQPYFLKKTDPSPFHLIDINRILVSAEHCDRITEINKAHS